MAIKVKKVFSPPLCIIWEEKNKSVEAASEGVFERDNEIHLKPGFLGICCDSVEDSVESMLEEKKLMSP